MFLNSTRPLCLLAVCAVLPLAVGCGGNKSSRKSSTAGAAACVWIRGLEMRVGS